MSSPPAASAATPSTPACPLHWEHAADDVHVATLAGEYAGFIAPFGERFEAHGAQGQALGIHATSTLARAAVRTATVTRARPALTRHPRRAVGRRQSTPARSRT